jgi:hypothetical protein
MCPCPTGDRVRGKIRHLIFFCVFVLTIIINKERSKTIMAAGSIALFVLSSVLFSAGFWAAQTGSSTVTTGGRFPLAAD